MCVAMYIAMYVCMYVYVNVSKNKWMHSIYTYMHGYTCSNIATCNNEIQMCILYSLIMINYYMHSS